MDGIRKTSVAKRDERERQEAREAVERPAPAGHERRAEHEQEIPDHAPRERAAHDLGEAVVHRDQRDDQLRSVAEGRVQEPADARTRVLGGVLGRLADQPGQRDEGERCEDELERLRRMHEVVQRDRDRPERERGEEDLPNHGSGP